MGKGMFKPEEGSVAAPFTTYHYLSQLEIDFKAPVLRTEKLNVLVGYKYFIENYDLNEIGADFSSTFNTLNDHHLKSNSLSLYMTRPLNETKYLALRFRYSTNGNYRNWINFNPKYAIYKGLVVYGIKPHEDLEWGIGLSFSQSFRRTYLIPFLIYNRNFNDHWGLEAVLPASIQLRYNINPKNLALFGFEYESQSYRLSVEETPQPTFDYAFNRSAVLVYGTLEHQFFRWIWSSLKFGFQMNFSTEFEGKTDLTSGFRVEPSNGLFISLGFFISPPDDLFD
ncbi:MAG: hypothetical protein DHS20C18_52970 [Saprospiraceae bacterium]|nr:MAG: hypothetical protein DHS20C18_52970 [Saprospiraceae bacterium]